MSIHLVPYAPERDVYRLLQIPPEADISEVIAACRRLAATFHPDLNGSPRATQEMQVVNAIRRMLSDPRQRAVYDAGRRRYLAEHYERQVLREDLPTPTDRRPVGPGWLADTLGARLRRAWNEATTTSEPGACPACSAAIEPEYRFCGSCGNRLLASSREGARLRR